MFSIPFYYYKTSSSLKNEMLYASNPLEWTNTIVTTILANGSKNDYQILLNTDDASITESAFKNLIIEQSLQIKNNLILELKILNKSLIDALVKGLLIMFSCLSIIYLIDHFITVNYIAFVSREALYIIGWVSMWKSVELLIFDRTIIKNKLRILENFPTYRFNIKQHEL
jgi:hypothetical protein